MQKLMLVAVMALLMNLNTFAQETISPAKQKAMEKLEFIVGQWSGGGWMMNREGEKQTFKQTEAIQWKVGKAIILIEGQGKQGEKIVHDALAIISYDETADQYNFRSYLASGREGSYTATIEEDQTFIWAIEAPGVTIKYTIQVKDDHWHEIGEMKRGESWFQFFEMDLDRLTK